MATRADRNNNPGNLVTGDRIIYAGQIGTDSSGFAIFNSWDAGVRAADLNLQSYGKQGFDTPYEIAHRWSQTDQDAYTANLATSLGVGQNTPVDMTNPQVRQSLLDAIFKQEGNTHAATPDLWGQIQAAAEKGTPLTIPFEIFKAAANAASNVVSGGAVPSATGAISDAIGGAFHFDLGQWLSDQASGAAKQYLIPIAVGLGAIILVMVSGWGLVKDTPVGSVVKTARKAAVVGAVL